MAIGGIVGWMANGLWGNAETDKLARVSNIHDEKIKENREKINSLVEGVNDNSKAIHGLEKVQYLEGQIIQQEELLNLGKIIFDTSCWLRL